MIVTISSLFYAIIEREDTRWTWFHNHVYTIANQENDLGDILSEGNWKFIWSI